MQLVGVLLTLCVAIAALRAAASVLFLSILGAIVISALVRPRETLGCVGGAVCLGTVCQHPIPAIAFLTILALLGTATRR